MNSTCHLLYKRLGKTLGWFKNPVSCQTEKLMAGTKFSDYLGLKRYKKAGNSGYQLKKYVLFSYVMNINLAFLRSKIMVKIGVIFMPFSNPTCHFKDAADFTPLQY